MNSIKGGNEQEKNIETVPNKSLELTVEVFDRSIE